jgi:hypothetical protein
MRLFVSDNSPNIIYYISPGELLYLDVSLPLWLPYERIHVLFIFHVSHYWDPLIGSRIRLGVLKVCSGKEYINMCPRCSIGYSKSLSSSSSSARFAKYATLLGGDVASPFMSFLLLSSNDSNMTGKRQQRERNQKARQQMANYYHIWAKIFVDYVGVAYISTVACTCRQLCAVLNEEPWWQYLCTYSGYFNEQTHGVMEELYFVYPGVECPEHWREYYLSYQRRARWQHRYHTNGGAVGGFITSYLRVNRNPVFGKMRHFASNDVFFVRASQNPAAHTKNLQSTEALPQLKYEQLELLLRHTQVSQHVLRSGLVVFSVQVVGDSDGNIRDASLVDDSVVYHAFIIFAGSVHDSDGGNSMMNNIMYVDVAECICDLNLLEITAKESSPSPMTSVVVACNLECRLNLPYEVYYCS